MNPAAHREQSSPHGLTHTDPLRALSRDGAPEDTDLPHDTDRPHDPEDPEDTDGAGDTYSAQLEFALRGLLEVTVAVLERMDKKIGLASLRALQSLRRQGPCMVTELANDLDLLASTASRLSDRLAEAELITRRVSPLNRRATQLELAPPGQAVLDELVANRAAALADITRHMSPDDRDALLTGAQAFTRAREQRPPSTP